MLEEGETQKIIKLHTLLKTALVEARSAGGAGAPLLHVDNLFELLRLSNSKMESSAIEDVLREIWLSHGDREVEELLEDAADKMAKNCYYEAEPILDEILKRDPEFVEAHFKRATCAYLGGTWRDDVEDEDEDEQVYGNEMARAMLQNDVLSREPRHIFGLLGLSLQLMKVGEWEEARGYLAKLMALHPWCSASSNLMICEERLKEEEGEDAK